MEPQTLRAFLFALLLGERMELEWKCKRMVAGA